MKTAIVKLLLALTVSTMVTLAVLGSYIIAQRADDNPIVAPAPAMTSVPQLPSQAPRVTPTKRTTKPHYYNNNMDVPAPK